MGAEITYAEAIVENLSENMQRAIRNGLLNLQYITNYDYQRGRKAHGRITGILANVGFNLGYTVDIDCGLFDGKNRFDIIYLCNQDTIAVIDYESLNSYDVRGKPQHFESYLRKCVERKKDNLLPKTCILIVTLPVSPVRRIPFYCHPTYSSQYGTEWNKIFRDDDAEERGHGLYKYWYPKHRESLLKIDQGIFHRSTFCLCNLSEYGLEGETWTSPGKQPHRFRFALTW
jgi:hypothetical protein